MPLTLFFEKAEPGQRIQGTGDAALTIKQLRETFGVEDGRRLPPIVVSKQNVAALRAMGEPGSLFHAIADLVEQQNARIRVWGRE
jgi:hypothetical protein